MSYQLAIHGGAGTILRSQMNADIEKKYHTALKLALEKGKQCLKSGGSALLAVELAVSVMEDSPLFNAGKGSVFSAAGTHEMEASIMCGKSLSAGAVAEVSGVKNPVQLAAKVLSNSEFVYMVGRGAEQFAKEKGLVFENAEYFATDFRKLQLKEAQEEGRVQLDHSKSKERKFGTVGAVALDLSGNLAAATSTGGLTNKQYGRLGDSSMIGVGNYANNTTCAISCTGYGEYFIRAVVAHDVSAMMEYGGKSLDEACRIVVQEKLRTMGGEGGVIAIDSVGNICLEFNSEGMYRGFVNENELKTLIYK